MRTTLNKNEYILESCTVKANELWMSVADFSKRVFRLLNREWPNALNSKTKVEIAITAVSNTYKRTSNF